MTQLDVSVLDTGPCLNFFSIGRADLLFGVLKSISAQLTIPDDVQDEVMNKASEDDRFSGSDSVLGWALTTNRVQVLSSAGGHDAQLDKNVSAILGMRHEQVAWRAKDLGERMVMAHATTMKQRGQTVIVVIDEWRAQERARGLGLRVTDTLAILRRAALNGQVGTWGEMRAIYLKMKSTTHDGSLLDINDPKVQKALHDKAIYGRQNAQLAPSGQTAAPAAPSPS